METYTLRSLPKHFIIFTPRAKSSDIDSIYDYLKTQIYQGWLKTLNPDKPKKADHIITKEQVKDWMITYRPDLAIENGFLKSN
jgi:hypothetical protein